MGLVALTLLGDSECTELFTSIGCSQVLYMTEELAFNSAERKCKEKGSTLVEIWSKEEWKEVNKKY